MMERLKTYIVIFFITIIPTLALWLPFFLKVEKFWNIPLPTSGMATVVANYDGPLYLVVAKTFYNKNLIVENFSFPLPTEYYAAHFPLYPLLLRVSSYLIGYPYPLLFVTTISTFFALLFFYKLSNLYFKKKESLWLTAVFSIFPARWLIVRSVGSAEPLFIGAIIASIYFFSRRKYLYAGIFGAIAQLTKSPGILLFIAYLVYLFFPNLKHFALLPAKKLLYVNRILKLASLFLIPISLLGVFYIYKINYGDFFAYFKSGDNIHLFFPPFQIFNYSAPWVGTFWLEEIIFVYMFGLLGFVKLIEKKMYLMASFVGVFFLSTVFVSHRDLIRYSLPIVPFLYIAFGEFIVKKEFKFVILFLIIPIYLFSIAYISQNVMPISDWAPFL